MMIAATIPLSEIDREVWDAIPARPRTPMRQYIWAAAYQETLANGEVRTFVIGPQSKPLAVAPFAQPANGPRRQVLLGAEDIWESVEVAAQDEQTLRDLAETIAISGLPLRFGHHPIDTPFHEYLVQAYRGKGWVVMARQPMGAMPKIDLDHSWTEPENHFSNRRRSDFRRMARKAQASGDVTFEIVEPSPEELEALMDEAFDIEARSWKGRSGTAIKQDQRTEAFYRAYARSAMEAGILRLCFMRIDGVAAAMQFAVECENRFWLIKVGYDEAYKHVSPGNLLMRETIKYAAESGLEGYEFLGKEAEWTKLWASHARPIATIRTYPYNLQGVSAFLSDAIGLAAKRIAARLRK
ncbi:MAG: hypothetical protein APF78_02320 [Sphingomonadales bacterium BRH_c3]|nr:MAG: hypothetical protein APF78_02320 [Sphingomonadales bacterium BRH_c3]